MVIEDLKKGDILENKQIAEIFLCSNQGGVRKSKRTSTIVAIAKFTDCLYKHKKENGRICFTGIGKIGDQEMKRQNKSIINAEADGYTIHVFEMEKEGEYIYQGIAKLYAEPFTDIQPDDNGNDREVIIFPFEYNTPHKF